MTLGRNWRDPRTWAWARMAWAYGFTLVGATVTARTAAMIWTLVSAANPPRVPTVRVDTSQSFRLGQ